jgi:CheY-like chemotaxis protein
MPRGGEITIATGNRKLDADYVGENPGVVPGEYASIEVTDTGTGMPPEVISRIFEPFYSTKERDKGTGLGLSMVFGFVKQSGGHISVYSEVGVGSTFRIYPPRNLDSVRRDEPQAALPPLARSGGETVLAVEDNVALRRVVVRQLAELGYRVLQAEHAAQAMEFLEAGDVDVLFTDVIMPGDMDGYELARAATARWPTLKVVLTSGFPETRLNDTFAPQNLRLLSKPYHKEDLARILRDTLVA